MGVKKRKILKITLLVIMLLVVMIMITSIYLGARWRNIIQAQLETNIQQISDGFYRVKIGGIRLDVLRRRVVVEDILLYPDSAVFVRLQAAGHLPPLFAEVTLGSLEVQGIRTMKTGHGRMLGLDKLELDQPRVRITRTGNKKTAGGDTVPINLYQLVSPLVSSVDIGEINMRGGSFEYTLWKPADTTRLQINHFDLEATYFLLDSTATRRQDQFYCDDIRLSIGPFNHILPGGLFAVSFDRMNIGFADSTASFDGLKLTPQHSKKHFAARNPRHTNWMELEVGTIRCMQVDYHRLLSGKSIHIDSIMMADVIYTNMKNREVEQAPIVKPMLHEYVHRLPLPLHIRTIHVQQTTVIYEDLPIGKTIPGIVKLGKMEGDFYDITNIVVRKDQYMTIKAKTYVQDEGILQATFRFPVDPDNNHFEITGSMGRMHLKRLNPMFEAFLVSIKKGMAVRVDFTINGNHHQAHLDLTFRYNDLYISLLKEKGNYLVRRSFLSDLANGMILFNDNPDTNQAPRHVRTMTHRNPHRSSFHFFWHTLMDGLKESIGITKKRQKQMKWLKQKGSKSYSLKEE